MEKKVLFTASTASHIRNFHLPYLRAFCEHGWTVHVACGGPEAVIPDAHKVKILPFRKKMLAAENLQAARTLRRMMEEEQYDLISTHTSLAAFFTRVAVKGMKKRPPVACMLHGYLFDEETPWLKQAVLLTAEKWMASVTDLLLTMNEWDYADGWVLKGDFSKFFYTLLHSYCYETARRALKWLKDPELIDFAEWLLWLIIDSTPDPGIPIGNQSSQLLALLYLDAFDHWLRDDRGLVYGRYMDDFYIIHSDKLLLRQILKEIEAYIKPLGLRLNGKTQILPLKNGIDFLGFHTYLTQTGKVVRKVRAKSIDNMKRKIRKFRGLVDSGKMTLDSVVQSYASWTGHISHGNTYHLRQNMDAYFFSYFPELKPSPKGDTTHGPKTEQPRKQVEGQVRQSVRQPDRLDRGR